MKLKRTDWKPTKYSAVCSKHILDKDYSVMFSGFATDDFQTRLRKDGFGIAIYTPCISIESKPTERKRSERKVRKYVLTYYD